MAAGSTVQPSAFSTFLKSLQSKGLGQTSQPITTSQPVSQGQPITAGTGSSGGTGQPITSGFGSGKAITTGGGAGQMITAGGDNQTTTPENQSGLQATYQNLLKRALGKGLEQIGRENVTTSAPEVARLGFQDFYTPNADEFLQKSAADRLARLKSTQTSDPQTNAIIGLSLGAQQDKAMQGFNQMVDQSIRQQLANRFQQMQAVKEQDVAVRNEETRRREAAELQNAMQRQQDFGDWASISLDALSGGDPLDQQQNQQSAEAYIQASTALDTQKKADEYKKKQEALDNAYSEKAAQLEAAYNAATDPVDKQQKQAAYLKAKNDYTAATQRLNQEFQTWKETHPLTKSVENQARVNRFINPTGFGIQNRKLSKGGQLSADDQIKVETAKSKLKFKNDSELQKLKKSDSLLLARVKKELSDSSKSQERREKLRDDIIRTLFKLK